MGGEEYKNDKPGLFLLEAMRPFFKSPCITVLPGEGGAVRKAKHRRDTNSLSSFEPMQKGAFVIQEDMVATHLFLLDPHHCFFQFSCFLNCSTIYYFW